MDMTAPHFDVASSSFLNHLQIERGLAKNSIAAYRRDLEKFGKFLGQAGLDDVDPAKILSFEISLRSAGLSPASINRIESTLRSFFKHMQIEYGMSDPTLEITPSKSVRRLPKALSINQIISIIDASFRESVPITSRDRAMLELLYSSGARVSELIGINANDINQADSDGAKITTIKLRGKGSKERIVPLGSFATKAIDDYVTRIRPGLSAKSKKSVSALFLNARQIYTLVTIDKVRETYSTAHPRARG
jgi:integrase/recombinase XerD